MGRPCQIPLRPVVKRPYDVKWSRVFSSFFSGKAFALLAIAMVFRLIVTFLVVSGNNLSVKDKIFVAIAWSPKATVQVRLYLS